MSRNENIQHGLLVRGWYRKITRTNSHLVEEWTNPYYGLHDTENPDPVYPSRLTHDVVIINNILDECKSSSSEHPESNCGRYGSVGVMLALTLGILLGHFL